MNLFCVIPNRDDATSFYRALQPLAQLRRIMPNLNLFFAGEKINSEDIAHMDVCFIQRPYDQHRVELIDMCHDLGVKVWVDYDDNLFEVPSSNPAFSVYGNATVHALMVEIIKKADCVTVSTVALRNVIDAKIKKENIVVIPNAFNDYLFKVKPKFKKHNITLWRGSQSHQEDLLRFAPAIEYVSNHHPTELFSFVGYDPWFLTAKLDRMLHVPGVSILKYHEAVRQAYPNRAFVCMSNTSFNRCKSNIAWIEATYAGAVTLAPQFEEWCMPGSVWYQDTLLSFQEQLTDLVEMEEHELEQRHKMSWDYIQDSLLLSKVNSIRKTVLETLV